MIANKNIPARKDPNDLLKKGVWLYFILLVLEGALRKWVLPGLASPLLIIRDPLALWLIYTAWNRNLLPANIYLVGILVIGLVGTVASVLFGHGSLPVAIYGARPYLIHFPLIFVIGALLTREDVEEVGKVMLYACIGMAVLITLQFYTPQSSLVNRGIGGDMEGSGFSGSMGFYRPSGTFSFSNGVTLFFSFAAAYIIYFWLKPGTVNKMVLIGATLGLLAAIPMSISRGLLFSVGVSVMFSFAAVSRNPKLLSKIIGAGIAIVLVAVVLSFTSQFQTAMTAFTARFENANASEGGVQSTIMDRYFGGLFRAFSFDEALPFFGYGFGILSNVGTTLLSGKVVSGISEGEWGKGIYESGVILGFGIILIRLSFSVKILRKAYGKLSMGDILPWMLLSFFLLSVPQGNWSQPTSLGFSVVIGGLLIASLKTGKKKTEIQIVDDNYKSLA